MKRSVQILLLLALLVPFVNVRFADLKTEPLSLAILSTPPDKCPASGKSFPIPLSKMPFKHPVHHRIDDMCPQEGKNDPNKNHRAQNSAKNNFTVIGTPVPLTFSDFKNLQKATAGKIKQGIIKLDLNGYPNKREVTLKNQLSVNGEQIGEGTLVTLEAFVYAAHYSNTKFNRYENNKRGSGESNNCGCNRVDWNDIHIALVESEDPQTNECSSVTAEISPHYRPDFWSRFHDGAIGEIQNMLPGLLRDKVLTQLSGGPPLKVRITGPLFYDASHKPCTLNGAGGVIKRESPARQTIWEIHPAYRIEVFDTSKNKWLDLDDWASFQQ